jgi:hypothetical protein
MRRIAGMYTATFVCSSFWLFKKEKLALAVVVVMVVMVVMVVVIVVIVVRIPVRIHNSSLYVEAAFSP